MFLGLIFAAVELAAPFADHMVLQRGTKIPVWGHAEPGESVEVRFADQVKTAVADAAGKWRVDLEPMSACSEGRALSVRGKSKDQGISNRTIADVLVGEVWLCAGQSNMEVSLANGSPHFRDRIGATVAQMTRKPLIRFALTASSKYDSKPWEKPLHPIVWRAFTPENLTKPSFSAVAAYFGISVHDAIGIPLGLVGVYRGATGIDSWTPCDGTPERTKDRDDCQPAVFWNTVVNPWTPFAARGMIWDQGEHDAGEFVQYTAKLHKLYGAWKAKFENPDLSFYYVQLCPWGSNIAKMQEAQARFEDEEPHAAMVVANDVCNLKDIHPNDKEPVGRRLALHALKRDYGKEFGYGGIQDSSPAFAGLTVTGSVAVVAVKNALELYVYNRDFSDENGFEIAGADGKWAKAKILNLKVSKAYGTGKPMYNGQLVGTDILLGANGVDKPTQVRYLHAYPWTGNLYNEVGLPMGVFHAEFKREK